MSRLRSPQIRHDSKSIALLAIFSAMVAALEVFPIIGVTDLKLVPAVPSFTIDWTGIPIIFILIGLGLVYSFVSIVVMGIAIGYRNPVGATFKVIAESLTVIGYFVGCRLIPTSLDSEKARVTSGLVIGAIFRAVGMIAVNMIMLPALYGMPADTAFTVGMILVPWNMLQASINILGGVLLFRIVPDDLAVQAGLGEANSPNRTRFNELETD